MGGVDLPEPMVPSEVDLRSFGFMPLDVAKLRDSDLATEASAEGFRAAVLLWCAAWHQHPAASLPDKPAVLAKLAGFGRDVASWEAVSDEALHNFVKCSDGRLYHPLIAAKAIEGWERKHEFDENREKERVRKAEWRAAKKAKEEAASRNVPRDMTGTGQDSPTGQDAGHPQDGTGLSRLRQGQGTMDRDSVPERDSGNARARETPEGLLSKVVSAFSGVAGNPLTLSAMQTQACQQLAARAGQEEQSHEWLGRYLATARRLVDRGESVWKGQPWAPHIVCSEKLMPRVVEAMPRTRRAHKPRPAHDEPPDLTPEQRAANLQKLGELMGGAIKRAEDDSEQATT